VYTYGGGVILPNSIIASLGIVLGIAGVTLALPGHANANSKTTGTQHITARLGQTVYVDGPRVTPLAVVEDSRCPTGVRCVWSGQVRLKVRVGLGRGPITKILTLGTATSVADGALTLTQATPHPIFGKRTKPTDYRFAFSFAGGL
jgi:hypothetical protein